jgi:hypothetical protein
MSLEDDFILALDAESSKTPLTSNELGDLSAWSTDPKLESGSRKISTAVPYSSLKPSPKLRRRYDKPLQPKPAKDRPLELIEDRRSNFNIFHKGTPTFTSYINSLIARNPSIMTRKGKILEKQKKLEVVSVKLHTSNGGRRLKSQSPEKLNRSRLPRFFEETFLIHQKQPPSISGYTMTVYPKGKKQF